MSDEEEVQARARQVSQLVRSIGLQVGQVDQGVGRVALIEVIAALMQSLHKSADTRNTAIARDFRLVIERAETITHDEMAWIFAADPDAFLAQAMAKAWEGVERN